MTHSSGSSDNVSQGFTNTTYQDNIAMTSYNYNYNSSENQFLYFSYLHDDEHRQDNDDDDAQTAYKRVFIYLFFVMQLILYLSANVKC